MGGETAAYPFVELRPRLTLIPATLPTLDVLVFILVLMLVFMLVLRLVLRLDCGCVPYNSRSVFFKLSFLSCQKLAKEEDCISRTIFKFSWISVAVAVVKEGDADVVAWMALMALVVLVVLMGGAP